MWGATGSVQDILGHFGNISTNNSSTYLTTQQIQDQISADHPFLFRWGWTGGGGHFLVGRGIYDSYIYYMDPWFGEGYETADYDWVKSGSNHTWTHTQTFSMPSIPGDITGNSTVCQNSTQTYSIDAVSGATSYTWTLKYRIPVMPISWLPESL